MKLLVCGGRDYSDRATVFSTLDRMHAERPILFVIHGDARGADALADQWARVRFVSIMAFRADWQLHGRAAGPTRNQAMIDRGKPDAVVAFPGGRGTADMVRRARKAGLPVTVIA